MVRWRNWRLRLVLMRGNNRWLSTCEQRRILMLNFFLALLSDGLISKLNWSSSFIRFVNTLIVCGLLFLLFSFFLFLLFLLLQCFFCFASRWNTHFFICVRSFFNLRLFFFFLLLWLFLVGVLLTFFLGDFYLLLRIFFKLVWGCSYWNIVLFLFIYFWLISLQLMF